VEKKLQDVTSISANLNVVQDNKIAQDLYKDFTGTSMPKNNLQIAKGVSTAYTTATLNLTRAKYLPGNHEKEELDAQHILDQITAFLKLANIADITELNTYIHVAELELRQANSRAIQGSRQNEFNTANSVSSIQSDQTYANEFAGELNRKVVASKLKPRDDLT